MGALETAAIVLFGAPSPSASRVTCRCGVSALAALVFGAGLLLLWLAAKEQELDDGSNHELEQALKQDPDDDHDDIEQATQPLTVTVEEIHRQVGTDAEAQIKLLNALRIRWHPDKNALLHDFAVKTSQVVNEEKQKLQTKQKLAAARKRKQTTSS